MDHRVAGLRGVKWRISYRTSTLKPDGQPVGILHDFYIPALRRAVRYDRVAGYFRSTSLAAASQGFSAFVGRQGKMQLIVGADLDAEDVKAILEGAEARLATTLSAELAHPEVWPEEVTRGVELLAWMVAHGYLDIRVAFRVHAQTGEALTPEALEDGYVHMKWAMFADAYDNRLYASGSLNESRTALTRNAENIDVHCDGSSALNRGVGRLRYQQGPSHTLLARVNARSAMRSGASSMSSAALLMAHPCASRRSGMTRKATACSTRRASSG